MTGPDGFAAEEYDARVARAQARMAAVGLEALLLTTEPAIRYFTGFLTRFWDSPTRPWMLILPVEGGPVAVIPEIGAHLMRQCRVADIRTFACPAPEDTAAQAVAAALRDLASRGGPVGVPDGPETHLRLPLAAWARLQEISPVRFSGDDGVLRDLRLVKSEPEIARIGTACAIAGRAFARLPEVAGAGARLETVFRGFQRLCLEEGADWVAYLAGGAGPGGYGDVISPATAAPLAAGDVLMLDTGVVHSGYYCDFDRNASVGVPSAGTVEAHARLVDACAAGFEAARPGATHADLFHAMDAVLTGGTCGDRPGRLGHGVGMELTEGPSILPWDHTPLVPGMVLALEPVLPLGDGQIMVHEENVVIRDAGAEWLSPPADRNIAVLDAGR